MTSFGSDLYYTSLSLRFEFIKHLRRRRLLIVGALAVIVPLLFLISSPDTADQFASNSLTFVSFLIIISGAMFAGDAISGEFEKKTGLLLFPTPQRRVSIFAGKYLAALVATLLVVSIYYIVVTVEIIGLFGAGSIPVELAKSYLVAALYSCSVVSIIFFFSSVFKKIIVSTLIGFFFLFMILPILSMVAMLLDVEPWFIVTYPAGLITNVLGAISLGASHGGEDFMAKFTPDFGVGIAVIIVYAIVFFLAGTWIANRRNME